MPQVQNNERKLHLKIQGTCKINSYCPAAMKLISSKLDSTCKAEYIDTTVGHNTNPGHINLFKLDQHKIAQKISNKIPFDEILDEVRT